MSLRPNLNTNIVNMTESSSATISIDAVQSIYESNFKSFFGYAYSLSFSKELANEIIQTVFARLVSKIKKSGNIEVDNLEAYVIRSIRNEFIDQKKKELKRPSHLELVNDQSPSAELTHINSLSNTSLEIAIEKLPTAQRTCVMLYYFNELSTTIIANEIGISVSTVKTHLQRAKATLSKKTFNEDQGGLI